MSVAQENEFVFDQQNGVLVYFYHGDQNYETTKQFATETDLAVKQLRTEGKPVLMLVDLSDAGRQDSGARKAGLELLQSNQFDRMAMVGAHPLIRYVSQFIVGAVGLEQKVRYFSGKGEALAWLKQSLPSTS